MLSMIAKYFNKALLLLINNKIIVLTLIFLAIIADILLIEGSLDIRIFGILGIYLISIFFYKLKSRLTFLFSLVLLGVIFISFILTKTSASTEKAAVWLFLFLLIGTVQQWRE